MDITVDIENYRLNVRTAGLIIHNNKLLAHKDANSDHYALIGGRIKTGEDSESAIKREIQEELGKKVKIIKYVSTIENFFEMNKIKYHEILFIHQVEFVEDEDKKIEYTLNNAEGKENLHYEWIDLDKIEQYELLPKIVKKVIKENEFPVHNIEKNY